MATHQRSVEGEEIARRDRNTSGKLFQCRRCETTISWCFSSRNTPDLSASTIAHAKSCSCPGLLHERNWLSTKRTWFSLLELSSAFELRSWSKGWLGNHICAAIHYTQMCRGFWRSGDVSSGKVARRFARRERPDEPSFCRFLCRPKRVGRATPRSVQRILTGCVAV